MVAALCEEVKEPAREVPRAMGKYQATRTALIVVLSVLAAAITGIVYLVSQLLLIRGFILMRQLPINFVLPDIEPLLNVASLQPMPLLYQTVTGSTPAAIGLLFLSEGRRNRAAGRG